MLYLKQCEGRARGEKITVTRVTGDMGRVIGALSADEARYIDARPVDVEDIGNLFPLSATAARRSSFPGIWS